MTFLDELRQQRWDDHRYYHQNRINQFLHLLSALCFLVSYVLIFIDPVLAVMIGWLLAMVLRQLGHFFFEPLSYDQVNQVSHEHKESLKVGYNLRRKVILLFVWVMAPVVLFITPTFFGIMDGYKDISGLIRNTAILWIYISVCALVFRIIYLFFIMGVQSGLVWFVKIISDPFHDVRIYFKSPYYILKGEMYDDMSEWYEESFVVGRS